MFSRLRHMAVVGVLASCSSLAHAGVGLDYAGGNTSSDDQPYNFSVSTICPATMGTQSVGVGQNGGGQQSHRDVHFLQHGFGGSMQTLGYRTSFPNTRRSRSTGGSSSTNRPIAGEGGGGGAGGSGGTGGAGGQGATGGAGGIGGGSGGGGGGGVTDPNAPVNSVTNYQVDPKGPDTSDAGGPTSTGGLTPSVVPEPAALAIWSIAGIALVAATRRVSRATE